MDARRPSLAGPLLLIALILGVLFAGALLTGCSGSGSGDLAGDTRAPVTEPAPPDLGDPESAVRSYLEWISFAYVRMDAGVAAHAMSVFEEVRVDSYIQRNLQEQARGIHQVPVDAAYRLVSLEETSAVVAGSESWVYRYFDVRTRDYTSGVLEASYDVTYTVVVEEGKGWVVDRVEATPRGEVE